MKNLFKLSDIFDLGEYAILREINNKMLLELEQVKITEQELLYKFFSLQYKDGVLTPKKTMVIEDDINFEWKNKDQYYVASVGKNRGKKKSSFDYFIHKDLGLFLRKEFDIFILLNRLDNNIKLKEEGEEIIKILERYENLQKSIWEEIPKIEEENYCITFDKLPEELKEEVLKNQEQIKEWEEFYGFNNSWTDEEKTFLVLDTKYFSMEFKEKIIASFENLDEELNGLLIHSENFQALNFLQEKYREGIDTIYIDPPYNTNASEIIYKNGYKHSTWLSLMENRLFQGKNLLNESGFISVAIDDAELYNLGKILDYTFDYIGTISIVHKPEGRNQEKFFGTSNEFMIVCSKNKKETSFKNIAISDDIIKKFNEQDENGLYRLNNFINKNHGQKGIDTSTRENRPDFWYSIYVSKELKDITLDKKEGYYVVYPITDKGQERTWRINTESFVERLKDDLIVAKKNGNKVYIFEKYYEKQVIKTHWIDKKYNATAYGTNLLKNILGDNIFSYPKSINVIKDTIKITADNNSIILDFFAGSGTTAHATIELNREDEGKRKYILVEMGEYFRSVTLTRVKKVIFASKWKEGKPQVKDGVTQVFRYLKLESFIERLKRGIRNE